MTPQLFQRRLKRELPAAISEVLLPALQWRVSSKRVSVIIANQLWESVFEEYARATLEGITKEMAIPLHVRCRQQTGEDTIPTPLRRLDFTAFLSDPGNQFALATCRGICEAPGVLHNPLYLYGPHGVGKSHLLAAVCQEFQSNLGKDSAFLCTGSHFVNQVAQELADLKNSPAVEAINNASVICIDGIDELSARLVAQEELYLLINRALEIGQQLVLSGSAPPRRLAQLEDRVSTRLAWGLSIAIDTPVLETKLRLLRALTGPMIDEFSDPEIVAMVELHGNSMQKVVDLAERLRAGQRPQTQAPGASFDRIIGSVAQAFQVRASDIAGKSRQRNLVQARQTALLLGRRLTNHSLVALGGMVGGRDHSTVLHSLHQAEKRVQSDGEFAELITTLSQKILNDPR